MCGRYVWTGGRWVLGHVLRLKVQIRMEWMAPDLRKANPVCGHPTIWASVRVSEPAVCHYLLQWEFWRWIALHRTTACYEAQQMLGWLPT